MRAKTGDKSWFKNNNSLIHKKLNINNVVSGKKYN